MTFGGSWMLDGTPRGGRSIARPTWPPFHKVRFAKSHRSRAAVTRSHAVRRILKPLGPICGNTWARRTSWRCGRGGYGRSCTGSYLLLPAHTGCMRRSLRFQVRYFHLPLRPEGSARANTLGRRRVGMKRPGRLWLFGIRGVPPSDSQKIRESGTSRRDRLKD